MHPSQAVPPSRRPRALLGGVGAVLVAALAALVAVGSAAAAHPGLDADRATVAGTPADVPSIVDPLGAGWSAGTAAELPDPPQPDGPTLDRDDPPAHAGPPTRFALGPGGPWHGPGPGGPLLLDAAGPLGWTAASADAAGSPPTASHGTRPGTASTTAGTGALPTPAAPWERPAGPTLVAAAAAGGVVALLVVLLRRRTRDPRDHPLRRRLLRLVRRRPGLHLAEAAAALEVDPSTVRYHADVLEDAGLLASATRGRLRMLYDARTAPDADLAAAAKDPVRRHILDRLARARRVAQARLTEELDLAPSTVSHHTRTLREAGLVEARRAGRGVELRLAEGVRDAVRALLDA